MLRYLPTNKTLPPLEHTDPTIFTLHVPMTVDKRNFLEESSFFAGEQADLLTGGAIPAVRHAAEVGVPRLAFILFLYADNDAKLAPLTIAADSSTSTSERALTGGEFMKNLAVMRYYDDDGHLATKLPSIAICSSAGWMKHTPASQRSQRITYTGLTASPLRKYWDFLMALNLGTSPNVTSDHSHGLMPSGVHQKTFWQQQILVYRTWIDGVRRWRLKTNQPWSALPYPPRHILGGT